MMLSVALPPLEIWPALTWVDPLPDRIEVLSYLNELGFLRDGKYK